VRIIAGKARGRKLAAPGPRLGELIRPTSDRAREALFNIIAARIPGARVLDLFAGTGALGLEALSRGADSAVFVDRDPAALALIEKNIAACGFAGQSKVLRGDLGRGLCFLAKDNHGLPFDLVFLDPPYGKGLAQATLRELTTVFPALLASGAMIILEDSSASACQETYGPWRCVDRRRYGEAGFWFYLATE